MLAGTSHYSSHTKLSYAGSENAGTPSSLEPYKLKQDFIGQFYEANGCIKAEYKKLSYSDGSEYVGQVLEGRHGRGVYNFNNGDTYLGFWKDDKFSGQGVYLYLNGDIYQGKFVDGRKHGRGVYKYKAGTMYDGEWAKDKKSGFGMHYYLKNEKYEGSWLNGDKHGKGTYYYSNGDKYIG